jgi:hypothetical protein
MIEIKIHKASQAGKPVEPVTIVIDEEIPQFTSLEQQSAFSEMEAHQIEFALVSALPGGTYDLLFAVMCQRKASHLRVPIS